VLAVDTNILVYAHRRGFPLHDAAAARLVALAEAPAAWAIPVFCIGEFLRVVTHPRLPSPHTVPEATEAVRRLLSSPSLELLMPGDRFGALLLEAIQEGAATGNLVFDAQIVAVCREWGVRALLTEDRDYARFPGLAVERL
jgi:hypothetical protein